MFTCTLIHIKNILFVVYKLFVNDNCGNAIVFFSTHNKENNAVELNRSNFHHNVWQQKNEQRVK